MLFAINKNKFCIFDIERYGVFQTPADMLISGSKTVYMRCKSNEPILGYWGRNPYALWDVKISILYK